MNVSVTSTITVKIQNKTIELNLEEAKELYIELGKVVAPYPSVFPSTSPNIPYTPPVPTWTCSTTPNGNGLL